MISSSKSSSGDASTRLERRVPVTVLTRYTSCNGRPAYREAMSDIAVQLTVDCQDSTSVDKKTPGLEIVYGRELVSGSLGMVDLSKRVRA